MIEREVALAEALADALRSSVLIVGHPDPKQVSFGSDFAGSFADAERRCAERAYPVAAILGDGPEGPQRALLFAQELGRSSPDSQVVAIQSGGDPEDLRRMINKGRVFRVLPSFFDPRFDRTIQEALEEHALARQNAKLFQLVSEQNERLTKLSTELEERVKKRERHLQDARERLLTANGRVEALHRALVAVHRARSVAEMERLINDALRGALGLAWTRIAFNLQSGLNPMRQAQARIHSIFVAALLRGKETLGELVVARELERPFARDEIKFLQQIAEAVSLAIDRLAKLKQSETLKHQWEATFDAIDEPVAILDNRRTILRTNRAFAVAAGTEPGEVNGRTCFSALFARSEACATCSLGANFRLPPSRVAGGQNPIYQVFSQSAGLDTEVLFINMYRDVSLQLRLESQLLESAKMAELGTIGSSIAHELNNPLGGMLSFLQLIKADLKGDEACAADIDEMEKGARRCADIVQNLLGFARKSGPEGDGEVDLREVASQALKIAELQTRAMGVRVALELCAQRALARGQFNLLTQAIRFFLQNAQESIAARDKIAKAPAERFRGEIAVRTTIDESGSCIEIEDNGVHDDLRPQNDSPMAEIALDIVRSHGGSVEIQHDQPFGTRTRIAFPRPNA